MPESRRKSNPNLKPFPNCKTRPEGTCRTCRKITNDMRIHNRNVWFECQKCCENNERKKWHNSLSSEEA